ncbi:MAG: asparaginase [Oscillospiraceae bacterium]|nr:asparaginase [Oscillospiraceae bacterium]
MKIKPRILLLATGGTIASVLFENGLAPGLEAGQLLHYIPEVRDRFDVDAVQLCNLDSTNMTPAHWVEMVCAVERDYDAYDGFVICHGTDTMAYTSAALSYLIRDSRKPIVVTGSQKPIGENSTDARQNLIDSIQYAADPVSQGVVLVFNGSVIAGTRAKKTYASSYNAFSSVNFPALAVIRNGRIIRFFPQPPCTRPVRFLKKVSDSVVVLKLIPGTRPDLVEDLFRRYDCIVIESFGVGGVPSGLQELFYRQMEQWIARGKLVVFATQVVNEGSDMEIYEVGQKVKKDLHLMEAYDMTLEATVTKLMVLMAECGGDYRAVREGFYTPVNYDLLGR